MTAPYEESSCTGGNGAARKRIGFLVRLQEAMSVLVCVGVNSVWARGSTYTEREHVSGCMCVHVGVVPRVGLGNQALSAFVTEQRCVSVGLLVCVERRCASLCVVVRRCAISSVAFHQCVLRSVDCRCCTNLT